MSQSVFIFIVLVSFGFFVFTSVSFLIARPFPVETDAVRLWSVFLSAFVFVLLENPIRKFFSRLTARRLFRENVDYQKLLEDASSGISKIKSLHHLFRLIVHFLTLRLHIRHAAILVYHEEDKCYRLIHLRGYGKEHRLHGGFTLAAGDLLIHYLASRRTPVVSGRLKNYPIVRSIRNWKKYRSEQMDIQSIQSRMKELEAACCIPSFLGRDLKHVLVLGAKRDGAPYADQELRVLYTLAQESAIAIENARLYDQAVERAKELGRVNRELNEAQNQLYRALAETEVANKRLRDTNAQLIHEQKMATLGRLASSWSMPVRTT